MASNSSSTPMGQGSAHDAKKEAKKAANDPEVQDWLKKAAMAAAGIAVVVLGVKAVQKKREDDSAEGQAKNTAQKAKNKVKDIFGQK